MNATPRNRAKNGAMAYTQFPDGIWLFFGFFMTKAIVSIIKSMALSGVSV